MPCLAQAVLAICAYYRCLRQASLSLRPGGPLAASEATLEEAHGMWVPPVSVGSRLPTSVALSHFANLKALTLQVTKCADTDRDPGYWP